MGNVEKTCFGVLPSGEAVEQYTLRAGALSCDILTYGGTVRSLRLHDGPGAPVDVVLGFDTLEDYLRQTKYVGALIGRFANRIGGSRFTLDGKTYRLPVNDGGENHLHGGVHGFDKQLWTAEEAGPDYLTLSLYSPDGQEGYPGGLTVCVRYTLAAEGLTVRYEARSSRATPCSLTSHIYFNLNGHSSGPVTEQTIQLFADAYTPTDGASIPTGTIAAVEGTPMDLRRPVKIGAGLDSAFPQLVQAGGYDHNWVISGASGALRPAARAYSPASGVALTVLTTLPGIQFYSGNALDGCPRGKGGAPYQKHWGFCLETQFFPDAPNCPGFPSCILRPGETWSHTTVFRLERVKSE